MNYVKQFEEIRKEDVAQAGGKGANLGELTAAGIPVPGGAVVLSEAYERFMDQNGISPEKYEKASELREAILHGSLPGEVKEEVESYYASLGENARIAVRSSATAEDLEDASFAGQQETYLNVRGITEVLQKILECYASLWGDRAVSYRRNSGYDKQKVALAVVLQEMIESESAGVMFTSDPAGDPKNVHVNASYGLGEAVVSGIVSPDEYICDRDGKVLKINIGSKECKITYGAKGTEKVPVEEAERKSRVLSEESLKSLVAEGMKIEKHYGKPMDVEWAVRAGKVYVLQARAITTLKNVEGKVFTEADFAPYPKVKPAKGAMRESVLFNLEKTPTPYYPLDHDFGGNVGNQKGVLFEEFGISFGESMYPIDEDGVNFMAKSKPKLTKNIVKIPKYLKMVGDAEGNVHKADQSILDCEECFEALKGKNPQNAAEIGKTLMEMRELIGKTAYDRFLYALFPNAIESMKANKVLKKIDPNLNSYDILEGLSYVTADVNRAMAELAEEIKKDEKMTADVATLSYDVLVAKYPRLKSKMEAFLEEFGGKSDFNCYCFISKSWREEPDRFLRVLRPMLKTKESQVPTLEEGKRKFQKIMEEAKSKLSSKKYAQFERRVNALRHYHYVREKTQYLWESEFEYCRMLLRRLESVTGTSHEEYLYLFAPELLEVCEKGWTEEMRAVMERRKEKRPLAVAYWNHVMEDALAGGSDEVFGISGCGGQATGKVCIVRSPQEFDKLNEGDVLVCTYTDPEWTPLFCLASAVVVDTGGSLSHAAIVAREYGIPAVLATGDGSKKLRDGDLVMVDGTAGKVKKMA